MKTLQRIGFLLAILIAALSAFIVLQYYRYQIGLFSGKPFFQALPYLIESSKEQLLSFYSSYSNIEGLTFTFLIVGVFLLIFSLIYSLFYYLANVESIAQRKILQKAFSQYISPSVIQDIISRPDSLVLGGKSAYLTAYFIDINDFSRLMGEYHPKQIVEYLNDYFSIVSDIILKNEGTIDKYEGDAVMAFWGAPKPDDDHAIKACRTALEHQRVLAELRPLWKDMHRPEFFSKIGIASGDMVVGNIGSKGHFNYTVIGRAVNIGVELEKLNKVYGTDILVLEKTYHKAKHDFEFREIDEVEFKGYNQKIRVFELLAEKGQLIGGKGELVSKYHEALIAYRNKDKESALKAINHCLRITPEDKASQILKKKIDLIEVLEGKELVKTNRIILNVDTIKKGRKKKSTSK